MLAMEILERGRARREAQSSNPSDTEERALRRHCE